LQGAPIAVVADPDPDADEARIRDLIAEASAAARVTFPTCPLSESRGQWQYVVGLVGKPSAGKSTFFNAVTKPASEVRTIQFAPPIYFATLRTSCVSSFWIAHAHCTLYHDSVHRRMD
jgi:50S ribosomal subunit-associated GTPase HflX